MFLPWQGCRMRVNRIHGGRCTEQDTAQHTAQDTAQHTAQYTAQYTAQHTAQYTDQYRELGPGRMGYKCLFFWTARH